MVSQADEWALKITFLNSLQLSICKCHDSIPRVVLSVLILVESLSYSSLIYNSQAFVEFEIPLD